MCEAARRGKLQLVLNVKLIHGSHVGMLYLGRSGYMVQVAKLSKEIVAENRHDLLQQINGLRDRFVFQTFSVLEMPQVCLLKEHHLFTVNSLIRAPGAEARP